MNETKICPNCDELMLITYFTCPRCGYFSGSKEFEFYNEPGSKYIGKEIQSKKEQLNYEI